MCIRDRVVLVDAELGLLAEPEEVGWLLAMNVLQDVESCHHVAKTPSRNGPVGAETLGIPPDA
eukprot:6213832-Prymnesium_polylepis.1